MTLYESIPRRRSFTSFIQEPLEASVIDGLVDFLSDSVPPVDDIDWNFDTLPYVDMVRIADREPGVKAPHYLVLRAERKEGCLQNCGYLGERAVLYLTSLGIATRWQGSITVGEDFPDTLPYVTAIAFGRSSEPFRSEEDLQLLVRLPMKKLCFGQYQPFQSMIEAARLAPSAYNRQPCVYVGDNQGKLHVYRKKALLNHPIVSALSCIDTGVALAHLQIAAEAEGKQYAITRLYAKPAFKSYIYQFTLGEAAAN